jgi:hypothetical protein
MERKSESENLPCSLAAGVARTPERHQNVPARLRNPKIDAAGLLQRAQVAAHLESIVRSNSRRDRRLTEYKRAKDACDF